jgi:FHS family glucose/mannose:H+ symporter-like MFS transporter
VFRGGALALIALALGRATVSFQFQSITPTSGQLGFPVTPAALGVLLGAYMAPGAVVAVAAPALLRKLGWRALLGLSFFLMAAGQGGVLLSETAGLASVARLLAGIGGCIVYVVTVGFVADLHDAGPLARRMGIVASSWPSGNALALLLLGSQVLPHSVNVWVPVLFILLAGTAIGATVSEHGAKRRQPADDSSSSIGISAWWVAIRRVFGVALSFALYNVAFILLTSFSPDFLRSEGLSAGAAASIASLPMWLFVLSVPVGGMLAAQLDRRHGLIVAIGCLGSAAALVIAGFTPYKVPCYVVAGLLGGLPTAAMWASAGRVDHGGHRPALTYPALFLVFFVSLIVFPPFVGWLLELTRDLRLGLWVCAALLVLAFMTFQLASSERLRK